MSPDPPPKELKDRNATIQLNSVNSVKVPCDPLDTNWSVWYDTRPGMQPVRDGNVVTGLVDGTESFTSMMDAMTTATSDTHYIYMLNWWMEKDLVLTSSKLIDVLSHATGSGVQVRAMLWNQKFPLFKNQDEVNAINALTDGAAILDNNTLNAGSHHQKILIVKGSRGLIAFCGGIDFNTDRIAHVSRQPGSPMHDVHCRILGPAAWDLLQIFVQRWSDHPESLKLESKGTGSRPKPGPVPQLRAISARPDPKIPEPSPTITEPVPGAAGRFHVQIGRTYGNGNNHAGIQNVKGGKFYTFAPNGEQTAQRVIFHAIAQAQQFIYIEDQYLISMDASNALLSQLPKIQRLIILIAHSSISDLPGRWKRRKAFIDHLKSDPATRSKVTICYRKPAGLAPDPKKVDPTTNHTYIHAKMFIIDDKFAIIGSANCNNRGYNHDSEVVAGIFDESSGAECALYFPHELRMRLWAEHLNLKPIDVFDPLGSAHFWVSPVNSASVALYDENADTDPFIEIPPDGPLTDPVGS